jgi:hypothetical protein
MVCHEVDTHSGAVPDQVRGPVVEGVVGRDRVVVRNVTLRPESPLQDGERYPHRLRNNWVMPATTAVASTQPRMIISQV